MSVNSVSITGNLTRDPELRATQGGAQVLSVGVAVNERVRNRQTEEWEDRPSFVDVVVYGKRAEALSRILAKGAKVAVHGRLRQDRWQDDQGNNRSRLEVVADEVDLMQRRADGMAAQGGGGQGGAAVASPGAAATRANPAPGVADDLYAEDIPF